MESIQSSSESAETVIGHQVAEIAAFRPLASYRKVNGKDEYRVIDVQEPPEIRHKRNMLGSELLLRRLRRMHFDQAPDSWKRRFVPAPIYPTLVAEYLRSDRKNDHATRPAETISDPEIMRAMAEAEWVAKNIGKVPMKLIVAVAARYYKVTPTDIISPTRREQAVRARMACYFLGKNLCGYSTPEIGRKLGGRDHTSVLSGLKKLQRLIESDDPVLVHLETLRAQVVAEFERMQESRAA